MMSPVTGRFTGTLPDGAVLVHGTSTNIQAGALNVCGLRAYSQPVAAQVMAQLQKDLAGRSDIARPTVQTPDGLNWDVVGGNDPLYWDAVNLVVVAQAAAYMGILLPGTKVYSCPEGTRPVVLHGTSKGHLADFDASGIEIELGFQIAPGIALVVDGNTLTVIADPENGGQPDWPAVVSAAETALRDFSYTTVASTRVRTMLILDLASPTQGKASS